MKTDIYHDSGLNGGLLFFGAFFLLLLFIQVVDCLSSLKVALNAWVFIKEVKKPWGRGILPMPDADGQTQGDGCLVGGRQTDCGLGLCLNRDVQNSQFELLQAYLMLRIFLLLLLKAFKCSFFYQKSKRWVDNRDIRQKNHYFLFGLPACSCCATVAKGGG